jgi:hypothetical protein
MHLGWSVSMAGNMDGDSYRDLVGGAPDYNDGSDTDAGKAEVLCIIPEFPAIAVPIFVVVLVLGIRRKKIRNKGLARMSIF